MKRFWDWYQRHYKLNLAIACGLFALQLVHLFWLTTHVVWLKAFGFSLFNPSGFWQWIIILVDYTEIPALITTSLVYINALRQKFSWKAVWFLFSLNIQIVHMFWITDEFVVSQFTGAATALPGWLAWVAIGIDYLELPVIYETVKIFIGQIKQGDTKAAIESLRDRD